MKAMTIESSEAPRAQKVVELTWKNLFILLSAFAAFGLGIYWVGLTSGTTVYVKEAPIGKGENRDNTNPDFDIEKNAQTNGDTTTPGNKNEGEIKPPVLEAIGFDIDKVDRKIDETIKVLEDYYGKYFSTLSDAYGINEKDTPKLYQQWMEVHADKIKRALVQERPFVIGVIGSSVAASHDNCNYDSYERQLERFIGPVWDLTKSSFSVRNAGEGGACGDSHRNQIFCFQHTAGNDIDILHYSWTYFESEDAVYEHEAITRWALMLDKTPPVQIVNVGGHADEPCPSGRDTTSQIYGMYAKFGFNMLCLEKSLNMVDTFSGKVWGQIGDGIHNTTRYGDTDEGGARKDSLGVVWRNWHPGPLGFQKLSDMLALQYLKAMKLALKQLSDGIAKKDDLKKLYGSIGPVFTQGDLPVPYRCDKKYPCVINIPPACTSFEDPTYGWGGVKVTDYDDTLNPYRGTERDISVDEWKVNKRRGEPMKIPKKERQYEKCQHLDICGAITASKPEAGILSLRLPAPQMGGFIVCCDSGKTCAKDMFIDNKIEFLFEGKVIDFQSNPEYYPNQKCVRVMKIFPEDMDDGNGHPYIGVRLLPGANPVRFSQFITY